MKTRKSFALLMGMALLAGCSNDDKIVPAESAETATMNVQLQGASTRADTQEGTTAENKISGLEFYVFKSDGSLDTKVGSGTGYVKISESQLKTDRTYRFQVSEGQGKKVLVVANASIGTPASSATFASIKKGLSSGEFSATNSRTIPTNGFEMSGITEDIDISAGQMADVTVKIRRMVSKANCPIMSSGGVSVALSTQAEINKAFGEGTTVTTASTITFNFKGYAVINGLKKTTVSFLGWSNWTENEWTSTFGDKYLTSTFNADGSFSNAYSGKVNNSYILDGTITGTECVFLYENKPIRATSIDGNGGSLSKSVYAFIIKGELSSGTEKADRYWRVNFFRGDDWKVSRNTVYNVTISKISSPGYATPQDATGGEEEVIPDPSAQSLDFIVEVDPWDVAAESTEM